MPEPAETPRRTALRPRGPRRRQQRLKNGYVYSDARVPSPIYLFVNGNAESRWVRDRFVEIGIPHSVFTMEGKSSEYPLLDLPGEGLSGLRLRGQRMIRMFFLSRFRQGDQGG